MQVIQVINKKKQVIVLKNASQSSKSLSRQPEKKLIDQEKKVIDQ